MRVIAVPPSKDSSIDLRAVTVRPTRGAREHRRWDRPVAEHHSLPFHGVIDRGLRHVAVHRETWHALLGWQPGAFKLAARSGWIGWSAEQQFRRLHLIANSSRFVLLTAHRGGEPGLAGAGLSLRRLAAHFQAVHGHLVLVAATFVDPSKLAGICCRASSWCSLGRTRGFARGPRKCTALAPSRAVRANLRVRADQRRRQGAKPDRDAGTLAGALERRDGWNDFIENLSSKFRLYDV